NAAVRAAEAIGYAGAGTIEFIVDGSDGLRTDGFWFMEMNTRLQVEHPVTEAITGVDLVEWQIRVAAGEPIPLAQEDLAIHGHAFEARLYAEDVEKGFLPATGRLGALAFPEGVRADTGVRAGDVISPHYDPMISKVIVHGATRDIALRQLSRALRETKVAGTVTNLAFLAALSEHEGFRRGEVDTGLIGRDIEALAAVPQATAQEVAVAAMVALGLDGAPGRFDGFSLWAPMARRVALRHRGEEQEVRVEVRGPGEIALRVGETDTAARWQGGAWRLDGRAMPAHHADGQRITVFGAVAQVFDVIDPLERAAEAGSGDVIEAPMPGLVKLLTAEAGQAVTAGQRLAVLEAMKMEHGLVAPRDGIVAEVLVTEGAQVEAGAPLIRLEGEE
ncbi:MAG: ATP-binding protein, partial [Pseudooceanicola nanhaiensis]|uniref:ATP-binding protein n=1 Tax=Pseudooceanicola nanhaiensis TaxID=375761 RepID=UPI004057F2B3